jgi:hypothetical protein
VPGGARIELAYDERMHPGTASLPNGQGMSFHDDEGNEIPSGVYANELTNPRYRDRFAGTPFHKFVPARITL